MANVSAILMAWKCSELLEKCYCIAQCQMSVDKWLTWEMWVSSLIKRKNICKTFSKPFSWYFFNTQLWFAKWFTKPCIFVLNKCSLKWADQKRLIYSNSKQEITNNDVIMCQYISTLKNKTFTMVTSHPWLRKRSNFVMRRGPTCINHPWVLDGIFRWNLDSLCWKNGFIYYYHKNI